MQIRQRKRAHMRNKRAVRSMQMRHVWLWWIQDVRSGSYTAAVEKLKERLPGQLFYRKGV